MELAASSEGGPDEVQIAAREEGEEECIGRRDVRQPPHSLKLLLEEDLRRKTMRGRRGRRVQVGVGKLRLGEDAHHQTRLLLSLRLIEHREDLPLLVLDGSLDRVAQRPLVPGLLGGTQPANLLQSALSGKELDGHLKVIPIASTQPIVARSAPMRARTADSPSVGVVRAVAGNEEELECPHTRGLGGKVNEVEVFSMTPGEAVFAVDVEQQRRVGGAEGARRTVSMRTRVERTIPAAAMN